MRFRELPLQDNIGLAVLIAAVLAVGVTFATCDHRAREKQAAQDLCYPYALDAVARTTGTPVVICADGERRPLRL